SGCHGTAIRQAHGPEPSRRAPKYCTHPGQPHRTWLFKLRLLFVPVLNSIRRSDGGGEKAMPAFGCELEKRSPYPRKPFLDKHDDIHEANIIKYRTSQ
ncbi:MAG: hypothetical protein JW932_03550, partial [Deltaproteobacteria bacterium]|nr:hypothetical protein [Deltaproteobacteria bacterium]